MVDYSWKLKLSVLPLKGSALDRPLEGCEDLSYRQDEFNTVDQRGGEVICQFQCSCFLDFTVKVQIK